MKTLWESIESMSDEEWCWGRFDCCQFARRVLMDTKGVDFAEGQPDYDTKFGAIRILRDSGGMTGFISNILGASVPPKLIRRGDVCVARFPDGLAAGICVGQNAAFASRDGVIFVPMKDISRGWRIDD